MVTRVPKNIGVPLNECTEFVLHKRYTNFNHKNVIDFTLIKLRAYADSLSERDAEHAKRVIAIIKDYLEGNVSIAWRRGAPVYLPVTRD